MRAVLCVLVLSTACESSPSDPDVFPGLSGEVRVERDDFGVVHVEAETEADALYASGYMQAHDRLLQMALVRLQSQGRRGEVDADWANDDVLMRTLGTREMGVENAARARELFPETHAAMVAWTAGVNQRIAEVVEGRAPLPTGFAEMGFDPEPWTVEDTYAIGKLILIENANQIEFDLLATIIEAFAPAFDMPVWSPMVDAYTLPANERPRVGDVRDEDAAFRIARELPADAAERLQRWQALWREHRPGASNNWAIDGRFTEDGRPLIAGRSPPAAALPHDLLHAARQSAGRLDRHGGLFLRRNAVDSARLQPSHRVDRDDHVPGLDGSRRSPGRRGSDSRRRPHPHSPDPNRDDPSPRR